MSEPWLAYLLAFALLLVGARQAQVGIAHALGVRKRARRRFDELVDDLAPATMSDTLRRQVSRGSGLPVFAGFDRLLVQSQTRLGTGFAASVLAGILLLFVVMPASVGGAGAQLSASVTLTGLATWLILRRKRARRMARFAEQLPEILDVITRSLRAGHPLPVSLALVAREMPEPAGPEFSLLVDEINYGRSVSEALENLHQRVGYPELRFVVASTSIAHQTGGNLGEILARLSRTLRDRFRLQRRARALSAEGRFSGYALSAMPLVLFAAINVVSPAYYADFWDSPASRTVLFVSIALLTIGNAIIYRLINFRV